MTRKEKGSQERELAKDSVELFRLDRDGGEGGDGVCDDGEGKRVTVEEGEVGEGGERRLGVFSTSRWGGRNGVRGNELLVGVDGSLRADGEEGDRFSRGNELRR